MANVTLIMGESGTGKSTSIRSLEPLSTFIITPVKKPLPFRGYKKSYISEGTEEKKMNYLVSENYSKVIDYIERINVARPEIDTIIIDDFQYYMASEFMNKALERGYDKFSLLAKNAYDFLSYLPKVREGIDIFVLTHSDINESGKMKVKTIGKMLDEKITIEGLFSVVLQTQLIDGEYYFLTQGDSRHIAKSPDGMFERKIPNDLLYVKNRMKEYFDEDIFV